MPTIKHILFPFDFSPPGFLAARFVSQTAKDFRARVTLLGVVPPVWDVPPPIGIPPLPAVDQEHQERGMKARLETALSDELAGLTVERATERGDPALKIAEFAEANAVDLIMMPTHGFGIFRSLLIGSVTAKVLHDAKCAIWTATHAEEQRSRELPRTILCAVDGTSKTPELAKWASEYSQGLGATLKLLHVVPPLSDWLALPSERELQEQAREAGRAKIDAQLESVGLAQLSPRVAVGPIADTITEEARQEGADLVIIGRGAAQSSMGRLRSHAYAIIQKSPCPVVSV
jgi:nucleotide-binding universal stress UspA family protein